MRNLVSTQTTAKVFLCLLFMMMAISGFTQASGTIGDVNSDGAITIIDALLVAQYSVDLTPSAWNYDAADVNLDGERNIIDALLIAQYYVGLITEFPVNTPAPTSTIPPATTSTPYPTPGSALFTFESGLETGSGCRSNWKKTIVYGHYIYMCAPPYLKIWDVTEFSDPAFIKDVELFDDNTTTDILRVGDDIYLRNNTWFYLDMTDPQNPGTIPISDENIFPDMARHGNYGYGPGEASIIIYDMSDPVLPVIISSFTIDFTPEDFVIAGDFLYIREYPSRDTVYIVDISNPFSPVFVDEISVADLRSYTTYNNLLYIFEAYDFHIYDNTDPGSPVLLGSYNTGQDMRAFAFYRNTLYLLFLINSSRGFSLKTFNISDPSAPVQMDSISFPYSSYTMVNHENFLILTQNLHADGGIIRIFDMAAPGPPELVYELNGSGKTEGIAIKDNYAILADNIRGIRIIDVSDPATPVISGTIQTECAHNIVINNTIGYLADGDGGVKVIDLSNPANASVITEIPTTDPAIDLVIQDNILYVTENYYYLTLIDISNPYQPETISRVLRFMTEAYRAQSSNSLAVTGNYAYTAVPYYASGFHIIDVSDPLSPEVLGEIMGDDTEELIIKDNVLYQAGGQSTVILTLFDVQSDPAAPVVLGTLPKSIPTNLATSLFLDTGYTLIGSREGVLVADTTDPAAPVLLDTLTLEYHDIRDMATTDTHLFIVNGSAEKYFLVFRKE
ncbi:MAG: hypothetical protein JXJ04_06750 [Spirochaetales bacterium]|nr:hypothetical protein [Spirochaetales bacterium]